MNDKPLQANAPAPGSPPPAGIRCPFCGHDTAGVVYRKKGPGTYNRRRQCGRCGRRFYTRESLLGRL